MDEPIVQQSHSTSTTPLSGSQDNNTLTQEDFWRSFRLFPFRFEAYFFQYWYLVFIGIYLFQLLVGVNIDLHNGTSPLDASSQTRSMSFTLPIILWGLGLICIVFSYNRWRDRIPAIFQFLLKKNSPGPGNQNNANRQEHEPLLIEYQEKLVSNMRYLLIVFLVVISSVGVYRVLIVQHDIQFYKSQHDFFNIVWGWIYQIPYNILTPLFWCYTAGAGLWTMIVTGWYIKKLTSKFDIAAIQPSHPDHCGGLKPLGDFCLAMALPFLIGVILLGIANIDDILGLGPDFRNIVDIFLVVIGLPSTYIAFFVPLMTIHSKMVARKAVDEDEFADRIETLVQKIRVSLDKGALEEAEDAKKELEITQALHPENRKYPTWPFDWGILVKFFAPQILSIGVAIATKALSGLLRLPPS